MKSWQLNWKFDQVGNNVKHIYREKVVTILKDMEEEKLKILVKVENVRLNLTSYNPTLDSSCILEKQVQDGVGFLSPLHASIMFSCWVVVEYGR